MDAHHFEEMIGWLLKKGRDDIDARDVAAALAKYLSVEPDADVRDFIKPLLPVMFSNFAPIVWPPFGQAIAENKISSWQLEHALGDIFSFADEKKPAILNVPEDILFTWAHANPDAGPAFVASVLPALTTQKIDTAERAFHPLMMQLLNEFGDRDDVRRGLLKNMHTFGWTGSRATYYALYEQPLRSLFEHPSGAVRRWAQVTLTHMRKQINSARTEDDEQDAHWNA